ncbi:MAG: hypothetical protein GY950_24900 [bacterium]|nr:hypothetical protein [bacterium]
MKMIPLIALLMINSLVAAAFLLRKHLRFPARFTRDRKPAKTPGRAVSNISWFVTRRLGLRKLSPEASGEKDEDQDIRGSVVGKTALVIEPIEPRGGEGKVECRGMKWPAISSEAIAVGERVRIVGRDVLTLIVEKINTGSTKTTKPTVKKRRRQD